MVSLRLLGVSIEHIEYDCSKVIEFFDNQPVNRWLIIYYFLIIKDGKRELKVFFHLKSIN
jgi:cytochrome c oxidase subunit IV